MKKTGLQLATACIALASFGRVEAANISAIKLDKGGTALVITGDIRPGDAAKFRSEASKYGEGYVLLESDGGSLVDAIDIGETIRLKGYATAVINGSSCNSACALIWLAGTPRALSRSGRIGFHAAYSDASGSSRESGVANAVVGRYLTLLNLPEKAVIFATSSPPSQLSWLTASNYASTGINLTVIDDFELGNAPRPVSDSPPPLMQTVTTSESDSDTSSLWKTMDTWSIYVDETLSNGCFLFSQYDNNTVFRIGVDRSSDDGYYVLLGNEAWKSLHAGQKYDVQFQFDRNSPWDVPTTAVQMGQNIYLMVTFKDSTFWDEFTSSRVLNVTRNGEPVTKLSMAGSNAAFNEMVSCQKYEDSQTRSRDPFAK